MRFFLVLLSALFTFFNLSAQEKPVSRTYTYTKTRSVKLDTNRIIYNEHNEPLRYYQYVPLINSGEYYITVKGGAPDDSTSKSYLAKMTPLQKEKAIQNMKIKNGIKSPVLQENNLLDIGPLEAYVNKKELDGKIIVLVFWNSDCPPCTESFASINQFLSGMEHPENMIMLAVTRDSRSKANALLKQKPLLNATPVTDASDIFKAYQLNAMPSYVIAGKDHVIKFAQTGQGSQTIPTFANLLKELLKTE